MSFDVRIAMAEGIKNAIVAGAEAWPIAAGWNSDVKVHADFSVTVVIENYDPNATLMRFDHPSCSATFAPGERIDAKEFGVRCGSRDWAKAG